MSDPGRRPASSRGTAISSVLVCVAVGCVSATTTVESRVNLQGAQPVERLVVVLQLELAEALRSGFEAGLMDRFTACRIESRLWTSGAVDPETQLPISSGAIARDIEATTTMSITSAGGIVQPIGLGATKRALAFNLNVVDVRSHNMIWQARSQFSVRTGLFSDEQGEGYRVATSIVSRLRDDGVLARCPPGPMEGDGPGRGASDRSP